MTIRSIGSDCIWTPASEVKGMRMKAEQARDDAMRREKVP